jgi:hypothetical protein
MGLDKRRSSRMLTLRSNELSLDVADFRRGFPTRLGALLVRT